MKVEGRTETIEKELAELKIPLPRDKQLRFVKLRGALKGLGDVSKEDLEEAKRSLFKHANE